jgi:hypothetical protein
MRAVHDQIAFTDDDVVNPSDFVPKGEFNPHNVRPFLLHDHGFTLAVVFADCLQDALDIAADADKLDRYLVRGRELDDYGDGDGLAHLGNAGEPFDIESLAAVELPNPPFSFAALFNAATAPAEPVS